jgi:hypothetical protein
MLVDLDRPTGQGDTASLERNGEARGRVSDSTEAAVAECPLWPRRRTPDVILMDLEMPADGRWDRAPSTTFDQPPGRRPVTPAPGFPNLTFDRLVGFYGSSDMSTGWRERIAGDVKIALTDPIVARLSDTGQVVLSGKADLARGGIPLGVCPEDFSG